MQYLSYILCTVLIFTSSSFSSFFPLFFPHRLDVHFPLIDLSVFVVTSSPLSHLLHIPGFSTVQIFPRYGRCRQRDSPAEASEISV